MTGAGFALVRLRLYQAKETQMADETTYRYYVLWIDQGPARAVYGSFFTERKRPVETKDDINDLKRIAGAKDEHDRHIVIWDWKRIN